MLTLFDLLTGNIISNLYLETSECTIVPTSSLSHADEKIPDDVIGSAGTFSNGRHLVKKRHIKLFQNDPTENAQIKNRIDYVQNGFF